LKPMNSGNTIPIRPTTNQVIFPRTQYGCASFSAVMPCFLRILNDNVRLRSWHHAKPFSHRATCEIAKHCEIQPYEVVPSCIELFLGVIIPSMLDNAFFEGLSKCYPNTADGRKDYDSELPVLTEALTAIESNISSSYRIVEPIKIGGASVVIKVSHMKTAIEYALKLPRPRGEPYLDTVKQEMHHLVRIHHENIISVHYIDEVPVGKYSYPFFIMDYIQNAIDLREWLEGKLGHAKRSSDLPEITALLAERLCGIVGALALLHRLRIIHFDVKPGNIFVDSALNDRPVLADLGYAKSQTGSEAEVVVGFTIFYAHPDLAEQYLKASSRNRVTKLMAPKNFKFIWDIYALGKCILELLAIIDREFPDTVGYDTTFSYLHLAACRMLDGLNLTNEEIGRLRARQGRDDPASYFETYQSLSRREFSEDGIQYSDMSQIVRDLDKLKNSSSMAYDVPELNFYFPHTVHISEHGPAPFTPRVKELVEHPVFSRLSEVPQLGLVRLIYPPATHTRLDHSIGAFRNACHYVRALYNDPYNPLFRQLLDADDLKTILVASLLHDLGHFPFSHELEDLSPDLAHSGVTLSLLDNRATNSKGRTLKEIVEDPQEGWGISVESIEEVLKPERRDQLLSTKNFKTRLLSSLIDGPIDVDKTDYLMRDSYECRLPYGGLIDYDRLVRNLTIIIAADSREYPDPQLGVYEKGQSAAEALTFARYLLYQALYWHHSARAIRVMLQEATVTALTMRKTKGRGRKETTFTDELMELIGVNSSARKVTTDDVLNLIGDWTDDSGKEIIGLLRKRKFYKRILTIHDERLREEPAGSTWDKLQLVRNRRKLQEELHDMINTEFINFVSSGSYSKVSLLAKERTDFTKTVLGQRNAILVDIPDPSYGAEKPLRIMPEPQRLQRNYQTRLDTSQRISEVWAGIHHTLMRIAAKSRVFCHPDARDTLMAALKPEDIRALLDGIVDKYSKPR